MSTSAKKPMDDKGQLERVAEELKVLEGVIDYAEDEIYKKRQFQYEALRRHAYGKTVVIETEKKGTQTFRLSSTPVVYPNFASGYATPHSPVGRLCSYLKPGDEDETKLWGEYRVLEVRLFDRFDNLLFEENVRNFLRMGVDGESGKAQVTNLRRCLAQSHAPTTARPNLEPAAPAEQPAQDNSGTYSAQVPQSALLPVDSLLVVEDEPIPTQRFLELDTEEDTTDTHKPRAEEYYGLSETFYINRTREQDAVISRSPLGPMFVEGVAGSGKTSAALGRTKMLADFDANSLVTEAAFRDQAGEKLEYWSGRYVGQFSQESCVGFVRTGELIDYLRETCRRLDLPRLPVLEYPALRDRLRKHRGVDRGRSGTGRWAGLDNPRGSHTDTTMAWLKAADRALASYWAQTLVTNLPTVDQIVGAFVPTEQGIALPAARLAIESLHRQIARLAAELAQGVAKGGFALDRLALRLQDRISQVRQEVLGKDVLWVSIGDRTWTATRERDLAEQLVKAKAPLYLRNSDRLVYFGTDGQVDADLELLSTTGQPLVWDEATRTLLAQGMVRVRDPSGLTLPARASGVEDLYLRLLPEATDRPFFQRDRKLSPVKVARGWGRARLKLAPKAMVNNAEVTEEEEADGALPHDSPATDAHSSVERIFNRLVTQHLLTPLSNLADAYAATLAAQPSLFPDPALAGQIVDQLAQRRLAEEDLDLLLCLAHLIGRGFSGSPTGISEPAYYQAVFVDEVQDFTEQQVYLMVEQARPEYRAVTVVGDIAQKLHNGRVIDILACFPAQGVPRVQLTDNLRQLEAPGLAWFSACYRAQLQDGLTGYMPSTDLRERLIEHAADRRGPELDYFEDDVEAASRVIEVLVAAPAHHTAAVILNEPEQAASFYEFCRGDLAAQMVNVELSEQIDLSRRHVRHFTSVTHAKGLEFDTVILPYLESYNLDDPIHINRLYVALTRARQRLVLLRHVSSPDSPFDEVWERYENTLAALC